LVTQGESSLAVYHRDTKPDSEASVFLRSLLKPGDPDLADAPRQFEGGSYDVSQSSADYVVERFDSDRNALVVRRSNGFPPYLAYSAVRYGFPWRFDLELTRSLGNLTIPSGPGPTVDVSAIVYPGNSLAFTGREQTLAQPGAKEVCATSIRASWSEWSNAECPAVDQNAIPAMRFGLMAGFRDPQPDFATLLWRREPVLPTGSLLMRAGDWVRVDASGYGSFSRQVFIRWAP
jgi:hypothetical protein